MYEICVNQINVHDMDKAIDFYCGKLGFEIADKAHLPYLVPLKSAGQPLLLSKVDEPAATDYPRRAQSLFNFKVKDLASTMKSLAHKGVEFLHGEPQECPVGIYAAFRDPSGNVHEFVEFRK